jgi:1-acyl-sn-glycerol-3-phosphate acyltransferase
VRLVAKGRLAAHPGLGPIVRKCGTLLIERGRVDAAAQFAEALRAGDPLFLFPEGTFVRASGVMPFRLGAFHAAAQTGSPVVTIALRGARDMLPDERWRFEPGTIHVDVSPPVAARGPGWTAVAELRDACRSAIAAGSGEPLVDRGLVMVDAPGDPAGRS